MTSKYNSKGPRFIMPLKKCSNFEAFATKYTLQCCIQSSFTFDELDPVSHNHNNHHHNTHGDGMGVEIVATNSRKRALVISSNLRKSTSSLIRSFTRRGSCGGGRAAAASRPRCASVIGCVGESYHGNGTGRNAQLVAEEYFAADERGVIKSNSLVDSINSIIDSARDDDGIKSNVVDNEEVYPSHTATTAEESEKTQNTTASPKYWLQVSEEKDLYNSELDQLDLLAIEVGSIAAKYLEECLSTEVSVLDGEKFDAIPEYRREDFTISRHLGKGSFSDVFEVGITVPIFGDELNDSLHDIDLSSLDQLSPGKLTNDSAQDNASNLARRRPSARRPRASSLCNSITTNLKRPARCNEHNLVFAMKCLRPQIRSNAEQFSIGAEDLVHETAMLASLDHPNIIKVYGRAAGNLENAFRLNDGYFILLDKLTETLEGRIDHWKKMNPRIMHRPMLSQIEVAYSISSAMSYLHSKNIVFLDLKPANVGFDVHGTLKLFDFGFAIGLSSDPEEGDGLRYDRCGTPRYMAPEVGLELGYGIDADVYSFGLLLWEVCTLKTPYAHINSAEQLEMCVLRNGERPHLKRSWPESLKEIVAACWAGHPSQRPSMRDVSSVLFALKNDIAQDKYVGRTISRHRGHVLRRSSIY